MSFLGRAVSVSNASDMLEHWAELKTFLFLEVVRFILIEYRAWCGLVVSHDDPTRRPPKLHVPAFSK